MLQNISDLQIFVKCLRNLIFQHTSRTMRRNNNNIFQQVNRKFKKMFQVLFYIYSDDLFISTPSKNIKSDKFRKLQEKYVPPEKFFPNFLTIVGKI